MEMLANWLNMLKSGARVAWELTAVVLLILPFLAAVVAAANGNVVGAAQGLAGSATQALTALAMLAAIKYTS